MTFKNGDIYSGEWQLGLQSGYGEFTNSIGEKYIGEFQDGLYSGIGTFINQAGDKYIGNWNNGKQNGQGTLEFTNNWIVEGEFLNDKFHGNMSVTSPEGVIDQLYYQYGSLIEAGELITKNPF